MAELAAKKKAWGDDDDDDTGASAKPAEEPQKPKAADTWAMRDPYAKKKDGSGDVSTGTKEESQKVPAPTSNASAGSESGTAEAARKKVKEVDVDKEAARLAKIGLRPETDEIRQRRLKVIQANPDSHLSSAKTFEELNLPDFLLRGVLSMKLVKPSAIQEHALPLMLKNPPENLIAQAQSGSGKTVAFCLGVLFRIDTTKNCPQALIVTPTRELAVQCMEQTLLPMAKYMDPPLRCVGALKGVELPRGSKLSEHVIVGTPGKVESWLKGRYLDPNNLRCFVLDEADEMLTGTFREDCVRIKKYLRRPHQSLLFSATFPQEVIHFSKKLVSAPLNEITLQSDEELVLPFICQIWVDLRNHTKSRFEFLGDLYATLEVGRSIVFCETVNEVIDVHKRLRADGYDCSELHSRLEGPERDAAMAEFREGKSKVLISSNVLSRGVDVPSVSLVVNYNMPQDRSRLPDFETYLHRIGRTGRFGRKGVAINLVHDDTSFELMKEMERHFSPNKPMIRKAEADEDAIDEIIKEAIKDEEEYQV